MADSECPHPVQMHGLCAICGLDLTENEFNSEADFSAGTVASSPTLHILHTTPHIKVTPEEAARIENDNMNRLLGEKKLSLVVDLDQTVLHATVDPAANDWLQDVNHPNHQHIKDIQRVALHDSPHVYYIKLRPGLVEFFSTLASLYELHIYTMGSRSYAHAVVKLFDPDGKLFHDRILSRDDNEIIENRKMLTRIFPTDDRMVVVIDDRSDVWPNCPNLVQVPAYTFFVGTGDIHNPAGMKANQLSADALDSQAGVQQHTTATVINTDDRELLNIQKVLQNIHSEFFSNYKSSSDSLPDVKQILPSMKQKIFSDLNFVFSGLLSHHSAAEEQYIWKLCTDFGAQCSDEIDSSTTHLISNRDDTEKVLEANEFGVTIVRPEWIYESVRSWKRLDESNFKIEVKKPSRGYQRRSHKRRREETEAEDFDLVSNEEFITAPIALDPSEIDEINKELEELDEDGDDDEDEDDDMSEKLSDSVDEFDQYTEAFSEERDSDVSFDDLEESLF